mmetsp:Transcript_10386/g.30883  ORF Transcript_10386/g.30883 Transcript_10386/m.30883 type:complete len:241 (+) Transcript_10386:893-1615(+)
MSDTAPSGRPASRREGSSACSMMAFAVPRASLPMRKTTVLPPRSTPVASASTFGLPSKTKPTMPSAAPTRSTDQPSWSIVSRIAPRWLAAGIQTRSPSIMPSRNFWLATRRVVDRPFAFAVLTSASFAAKILAQIASSSKRLAKLSKNFEICSSETPPILAKAASARPTAAAVTCRSLAGRCRTWPVSSTTRTASPGWNFLATSSVILTKRSPPTRMRSPAATESSWKMPVVGDAGFLLG